MKLPVPDAELAERAAAFPDARLVERKGYSDCFICGKSVDLAHACWAGNGPLGGSGLLDLPAHLACVQEAGPLRCQYLWKLATNDALLGNSSPYAGEG